MRDGNGSISLQRLGVKKAYIWKIRGDKRWQNEVCVVL